MYMLFFSLVLLIFFAASVHYSIGSVIVNGKSMENSIHDGDQFITSQLAYKWQEPRYNDIVILDAAIIPGHELYIKRVIGLPGDTLDIRNNQLYRNNRFIDEPYIKEQMTETSLHITVPKNHLYVMGDNRNHSTDSRIFNAIDMTKDVKAVVLFRIKPFFQDDDH
ncbi:signal peptidase I [Kurthia huakuii]|nr:signal peptidase I [Kurthia huakuii]